MHGKFLGAWQEMPHFALWCKVRGSTPRVPAMRDFAQCFYNFIIMATSKLNKEQYANIGSFAGIMLVYNSTNKDGELVQTAQHFFGADFEPADKSDNEIFRVIKNMVATMWHTIAEEKKLRADADGIRSKFRATTPAEIIICEKSGNRIKKYDLTDSVWARIGLVPTKVDLEKSNRDFQKTIHAAAKAIRNAMDFAPNLASLEKPTEKTTKTGKAEKVAVFFLVYIRIAKIKQINLITPSSEDNIR